GLEALEQQIKRHDLGQRGGMAACVGIVGRKGRAGVAVDDDGGERRAVALMLFAVVVRGVTVMTIMTRIGGVLGENDRRGDRNEPEYANPQTRGSQGCAKHELP